MLSPYEIKENPTKHRRSRNKETGISIHQCNRKWKSSRDDQLNQTPVPRFVNKLTINWQTSCQINPGSEVKVAQSRPTLCNPMDYTAHEVLQARILEWVAFPFSRGSSQPRDQTQVSRIRDRLLTPVFLGFPCGSAGKESIQEIKSKINNRPRMKEAEWTSLGLYGLR